MTEPMRVELTQLGVEELRPPADVDRTLQNGSGTTLVFVNSVCGCAAGMARPGLALALKNKAVPDRVATVFAGVDTEATARARQHFAEHPPTSPQIALFKDGKLVELLQRHEIEGTTAEHVSDRLTKMFDAHCVR
ncbi:MAG: BrxA/BrxB family bacilliredoxin [Candidatus Eisenbacteria bacterium]|nr:BrxA/BrxB family bacilliredoxin [Candidatus Eisenbacteria bacterium]